MSPHVATMLPMAKEKKSDGSRIPVREAKNRFSELVKRAANGECITITFHGEPKAQLIRAGKTLQPFRVDWKWLRSVRVRDAKTVAETLVRLERDQRD
jgi:prevent-host-death family protein